MNQPDVEKGSAEFNRRDFIRGASFGSLMLMMGGVPLRAEDAEPGADGDETHYSTVTKPVSFGVIGCGLWGKEVIQTLGFLPNAPVAAVCETYAPFLRQAKELAPKAEGYADYHQLLEQKNVEAVVVATPSHLHKEIVVAALAAGKHVYCEAPLASSIEDARAIAQAAKAAYKCNFQSGLQWRAHPQKLFLLKFIRSGAVKTPVLARAQWHKLDSWRRASAKPEREKALNWRLSSETSAGLIGEVGIHQLDLISWSLGRKPAAVTGYGGILRWDDGRDVPDTVQAVLEYPDKVNFTYDATLANSFDADYEMLFGTQAAIMTRGDKAWMFKEVEADLLGWEIYAAKKQFYDETGIALVLGASKSVQAVKKEVSPFEESPLHYSLGTFARNSWVIGQGVKDFTTNYGADAEGLPEYMASLFKKNLPAPSYTEGFDATVVAIKANEAVLQKKRIEIKQEWFEI
jgi:predicted dehydrogenase